MLSVFCIYCYMELKDEGSSNSSVVCPQWLILSLTHASHQWAVDMHSQRTLQRFYSGYLMYFFQILM